jgi:sugar (glycoside-pentoside-hexuronide) transporter
MKDNSFRTSALERWGFSLFMAGQAITNTFVGSFFQVFLTDIGVTAYLIGIMFLIARVWDAVNDPIFGAILDKAHLKTGKFIPWLRASNWMLPVAVVLLFAIPSGLSMGLKVAWSFAAYLLYDVAYTMCDVPIFAMTSAVTDQVHERLTIMTRNTLLATLTTIAVALLVPQIYPKIGGFYTSIAIAALTGLLMIFMTRNAKERFVNKDTEAVTVKSMLLYVKDNKYLRIGFLGIMVLSITSMTNTVMVYFAVYCLGDMRLVSMLALFLAAPAILLSLFMPALAKRFDKFNLLIFGIIGANIMSIVCYFAGYSSLPVFVALALVRSLFFGIQLILQLQFTGDFVEYGEYITGKRLQGTAYSIQTFVFKFMNAVPAGVAMLILGAFGFKEGAGAVQSPQAIQAIWALYILSPVAGAIISLPIFSRYKLRDKTVQIMAAANSGVITREEAETRLQQFTLPLR